ncbi:SpaH/EbpB family LPXTG-anchored major pilin [Brooklawnia cerclae]|uniref:Fimbrial isopeptide formation D2 family protein/LPXTG-motif cell wall-anchored protein n=1 Tax=Brooklawnia cerclae TaxID=349934 RepID=A0ABX0SHA7_9ACTN|nr:SpaH/EbpB family LPXTG-anchored major pilin [Brooklawnia cerclae]NIH57782.1 fimbrial isopeptide formation D2 family protein/LPXTG-motif cell wall-anchored protein [Brooklawnia cerclae]
MSTTSRGLSRWITGALGATALAMFSLFALTSPASAIEPVDIDSAQDGQSSIIVHKYEQPSEVGDPASGAEQTVSSDPIEGVDFTLYQLDGIDLTDPDDWDIVNDLNDAIEAGATPVVDLTATPATVTVGTLAFTLTEEATDTTDSTGTITFDTLNFGVYIVVEGDGPASIVTKAAPFLVSLPFASPDNTWNYDVHVYPKNAVTGITKTAEDLSSTTSPNYQVGDVVQWTIDANIPYLTEEGLTQFAISDDLDSRLSYIASGATVTITNAGGTEVTGFISGTDYTLTSTDGTDPVELTFTAAGLTKLEAVQGGKVTLTFNTQVTSLGETGEIPNTAVLFVNDSSNEADTETAFGQLTVFKYATNDDEKKGLEGATFKLYRDEAKTQPVTVDGAEWEGTTDDNGLVTIPVLKPGTYYLVETVAPTGYQLITDPIPVTIYPGLTSTDSAEPLNYVEVENEQVPVWQLPLTGGNGTLTFTWVGVALLVVAGGAALVSRRKAATAA